MRIEIDGREIEKLLIKELEDKVLFAIQENISANIIPIVKAAYNEAIEESKELFIPNNREAAELGIQDDQNTHDIDEDLRSNAWRALKLGQDSVAKFESFFRKLNTKGTFGRISIGFKPSMFYNSPLAHFPNITVETEESYDHRWMEWFIEGKTIQGHAFSPFRAESSRTGQGVMVKGGAWAFKGHPDTWDRLAKSIESKISKSIKHFTIRV